MMKLPEDVFWCLTQTARNSSGNSLVVQIESLENLLSDLSGDTIKAFELTFREILMKSYHYNIMAACKIVNGWVTDDSFLYFRCVLVALGKEDYYEAIRNPDSLAFKLTEGADGEALLYASDNAFTSKFGETNIELPRDYACKVINYDNGLHEVLGEDWHEKDLPRMCPTLWEEYM